MKCTFLLTCLWLPIVSMAQSLSGTVTDKTTHDWLFSATVGLVAENGKISYTITDSKGFYQFKKIQPEDYVLQISYIGYKTYREKITISSLQERRMDVAMEEDVQLLRQVSVSGRATRAEQKGDSLIYNAEAFKVLQGSTAEELLAKMPGVIVEGGTIQAQGEDVGKVLVDGKEFFDGDVNLALKNLPADIIASIEVFDKKSEQAEFTKFDDGEEIKTINIVTKPGFRKGTFGEVYGGYGTEDRYRAGGNINIFEEDRRISVLGMSNNINQQNFSQEDLAGVMSSSAGRGRGGRRKGGKGGGPANSANDFMVGSLGGITASNGLGLNYVDQWGEKVRFTGSYFFNQSDNNSEKTIDRHFFESALPGMTYTEWNDSRMENWNHRMNMKLDYQIDRNNSLQIKPTVSFQNNDLTGVLQGSNLADNMLESEMENKSNSRMDVYNIGGSLIYRHRFPVAGRTLSATFNGSMSGKSGDSYYDYLTRQYTSETLEDVYGQYKATDDKQYSLNGNLMFTDKLADAWQLQANYKVSFSNAESDRKVYGRSAVNDLYEQLDDELSNRYESDYLIHSGGIGFRFHQNKLNVMVGTDFQYSSLMGNQYYPMQEGVSKNFFSVLPSVMARYAVNRTNSFILRYRSRSSSPSVADLQDVVDNTNPLFLSAGNPDLDQQINHSLNLRYIRTSQTGHTFIAMAGAMIRQDYVADSTFVATDNLTLPSGIEVEKGAQYTRPVNLDGYYSLQSMLTYGFPLDFARSNINISISANYAHIPTLFNGAESATQELNLIPKIIIGSNISHRLDFTLSYSATVNKIFNSLEGTESSDYIYHLAALKFGWTFWKGFTLQSTFNYITYTGLGEGDLDYFPWNASFGKKFLKHNQAEIRLEACDLLKQNRAFSHQTGSNYYDYINWNVLEPYLMLSFTYTLR